MAQVALTIDGLSVDFEGFKAVNGVTMTVDDGELRVVLGANGAGKTTLMSTIAGLLICTAGTIRLDGEQIEKLPAHQIVTRRLVMVPEGGRLFPFMTVLENLELGAFNGTARPALKASLDDVLAHFPILAERRTQLAGSLSGGERQMCAIARAMMSQPKLLMLDEPSLGLAPLIVREIFSIIGALKTAGVAILLVEQNARAALQVADHGYVLETGEVAAKGPAAELAIDPRVVETYLGGRGVASVE